MDIIKSVIQLLPCEKCSLPFSVCNERCPYEVRLMKQLYREIEKYSQEKRGQGGQ